MGVEEEAADSLISPDGSRGWYAESPSKVSREASASEVSLPPPGTTVRLMGDYGATIALWSDDGLMFGDVATLERRLGISPTLGAALRDWSLDWERRNGQADFDQEALGLVARLDEEVGTYRFIYHR